MKSNRLTTTDFQLFHFIFVSHIIKKLICKPKWGNLYRVLIALRGYVFQISVVVI